VVQCKLLIRPKSGRLHTATVITRRRPWILRF